MWWPPKLLLEGHNYALLICSVSVFAGGYGYVFVAQDSQTGKEYALKVRYEATPGSLPLQCCIIEVAMETSRGLFLYVPNCVCKENSVLVMIF